MDVIDLAASGYHYTHPQQSCGRGPLRQRTLNHGMEQVYGTGPWNRSVEQEISGNQIWIRGRTYLFRFMELVYGTGLWNRRSRATRFGSGDVLTCLGLWNWSMELVYGTGLWNRRPRATGFGSGHVFTCLEKIYRTLNYTSCSGKYSNLT